MDFILVGHNFENDVQTAIQIFFPNRHYYRADKIPEEGFAVKSVLAQNFVGAYFYINGKIENEFTENIDSKNDSDFKYYLKKAVFNVLSGFTKYTPKWGMLTGVRPAKLAGELLKSGMGYNEVIECFKQKFYTSHQKAELALNIYNAEREILLRNKPNDISIYIGIPFCPTRCLYCSFTSYPIDYNKADKYIECLEKELDFIKNVVKSKNICSLYVGGGTPTSLNDKQFEYVMDIINEKFVLNNTKEFSVEAGRPDTITKAKLLSMKKNNVNRISINPQTMNQKTLDIVGRKHTVEDVKNVFYMARENGFFNINMDLILGLPKETIYDVKNTMEEIVKLSPESVTVHTLAVKRASALKEKLYSYNLSEADEMEKMLDICADYSKSIELEPYYMYRQKAMLGNFENVGYCKKGAESIYNIEIMEEKQTIIAAGAGASTKIYYPETDAVERIFNVKSVDDYISRIDEMIERKAKMLG